MWTPATWEAMAPISTGRRRTVFALISALTAASVFVLGAQTSDSLQTIGFAAHTIDTGLTGGYQVVVADLNRDNKPDILALASGLKDLLWYENPGWNRHVIVS